MVNQVTQKLKLARLLISRDADTFAELIAESQSRVRTFLVRLCRDYDLADDLAQETYLTAYQKLAGFKGSGSFEGWLCKIAYNRFLQHKRDEKRKQEVLLQYGEVLEVESKRYESISDLQLDLEKAFSVLNHAEAAAITLCHSFGFSHQEVAAILEVPLGTAKSQIKRGKEKLKEKLKEAMSANNVQDRECREEDTDREDTDRKVAL